MAIYDLSPTKQDYTNDLIKTQRAAKMNYCWSGHYSQQLWLNIVDMTACKYSIFSITNFFGEFKPQAKVQNPRTTPSGKKLTG